MKAVVYQEPYNVTVEDVEDPRFEDPRDANVRITSTAICGSDLHMYEGRTGAESGLVFGHENLGIVEDVGDGVTQIKPGDRVIVPFNVACGFCRNCERGNTGFCLNAQEGFAGGAYGYVSMGPYAADRPSTCACRGLTSTASSCPRDRVGERLRAPRRRFSDRLSRL
jgi:glutathione-independent formaldehyde dehydrogenase